MDAPDEYERRYMDAENAIARVRSRPPRAAVALVGLLMAALVGASVWASFEYRHLAYLGHLPLGIFAAAMFISFLGSIAFPLTLLASLASRVTVTRRALHVQHGLLMDSIPLDQVVAAYPLVSGLTPWLGRVLVVRVTHIRGRKKVSFWPWRRVHVLCDRPEEVARAVAEARRPPVRVGVASAGTVRRVEHGEEPAPEVASDSNACYMRRSL